MGPQTPTRKISKAERRIHVTWRIHYAHVTHTQISLRIIFSQSKFPTQYDRLSQQQLGFVLI